MKQRTENNKKMNIWKWLAAGSVALVILVSVACGLFLHWNIWDKSENANEKVMKAETEAVVNEEKLETRTFLNKPAPAAEAGDNRQVFRIIEVVPHEACSVFPYFVEWETEKGYDLNTPLGYDGIMMSAQLGSFGGGGGSGFNMFCEEETLAKDSRPFTYVEEKYVRPYFENLSDYDTNFYSETDQNRGGNWFRKTKDDNTLIEQQYGYFEYVGEGKGLYYINTSLIAGIKDAYGNITSTEGVHFEIQAVPRKGTEAPKGYMYVCDPAYFWSKYSGGSTAKPKYEGNIVQGITDYNYDLKFTADAVNGKYVVNNVVYSAKAEDEYAYDIKVNPSEVATWAKGFYYQEDGLYEVQSYVEATNGKYIRYADPDRDDGCDPANLGYFLLKESGMYEGATRYNVVFKEADSGKGSYMAKAPESFTGNEFTFVYRGKGKGSYKVSFLYAPESTETKYAEEIVEVSTGQGGYALTTTSTDGSGKPKYSKEASVPGAVYDYAEVVTYIDAYSGYAHGAAVDDRYGRKGVTSGTKWGNPMEEVGGWVFVPLEKAEDMKQTFLKDVKTDSDQQNSNTDVFVSKGQRIYVNGQKRVNRFYCKDGLQNNEWFKLLCYSNNPKDETKPYSEMVDGVGYDFEKTVKDNMNNKITQQLIKAFDGQFRIEIIQKEPQYLTVDDVKSADLIYISNQEGINGMSLNWNNISNRLKDESLPNCDWSTVCPWKDGQDISAEVLMTLYDECIYEQNRALIVCHSVMQTESSGNEYPMRSNLTKLYYMMNLFDNALAWARFMPEQYPDVADDNFSKIRISGGYETATVDVYSGGDYGTFNSVFEEASSPEAEYPQYNLEDWVIQYFLVRTTDNGSAPVPGFEFQNDIGYWANIVQEGETKLTVKYYIDPMFMSATTKANIWKILKNRKLDTSMLVIEVTNGEMTGETVSRRVIYADEFDPQSFDIKFKVLLLGTPRYPSSLTDITLTFEDGSDAKAVNSDIVLEYGRENTNNVRHGFTVDGLRDSDLNPSKTVRKVTITATDSNGKTASTDVYVIVREAFMLN